MKGDLVIAVCRNAIEIGVPGLPRIDAQLLGTLALEHFPGAFDIGGRERLAVMPFDTFVQRESQFGAVLVPRPALRQLGYDRVDTVLRHRSEERRVGKECRSRWSP